LHGRRYDAGIEAVNQALELFYEADDQWNVAGCLYYLGAIQRAAGDMEGATANLGRALVGHRRAGRGYRIAAQRP
jgi:hypothetical protein